MKTRLSLQVADIRGKRCFALRFDTLGCIVNVDLGTTDVELVNEMS